MKEAWACKRAEIRGKIERYELAPKAPKPSSVGTTISGSTIMITMSEGGGLVAWAWGASRVVDALELLGTEATGIDARRLAAGSDGEGGLLANIGGDEAQRDTSGGRGIDRDGDGWFADAFWRYVDGVVVLPYDHHTPEAYDCSVTGRRVYEALGVPGRLGFSQTSHGNSHCRLPASQNAEVAAFFTKFLLGCQSAATDVMKTDSRFNFIPERWIDWETPTLT
ncbi:hypothetical protein GGS23DRAFT_600505 [Durotheca rogersii]|uniref:uncharacterized protein n=1 Tax=Durotheca rogersii TaxID=419775 RepID=UPI00221F0D26|nr:uncharacterized protein GGS23DRAFT_600505 [Durotheca rogersii]KAI5859381.1 hypothetical protein GGS23DRAFT_600505 [Durotheca rogersii]